MKKKLVVLLMIVVMGILTGCGMSEDEAKDYVKASLDAAYKGEFDAFVEITDSTLEGAKAMYEENIIHTMEAAGFSEINLDDELTGKYKQLFLNLAKSADYTVGDAVKNEDDSLAVEVLIHPMTIFENIDEEVTETLLDEIMNLDAYPSEEEIVQMGFKIMYEILAERIAEPTYSEEQISVTINVHKNDEGKYAISEEDMLTLDSALFTVAQE